MSRLAIQLGLTVVKPENRSMPDGNLIQPPVGYLWVEDLSRRARKDLNTIVWLCEQSLIDSKKNDGRWGVRIVGSASVQAGSVLVHDLKAGRDITIGSIIGQYVTLNGNDPRADKDGWIASNLETIDR